MNLSTIRKGEAIAPQVQLNPNYKYAWIHAAGNCMDSSNSPLRIKPGDKILLRHVGLDQGNIMRLSNKIVCFMLNDGRMYYKHLIFGKLGSFNDFLLLRCYNPLTEFRVPMSAIKALFAVEEVQSDPNIIYL